MPFAITLRFDEDLESALTATCADMYANFGGVDLLGRGIRPHVTLASYADLDMDAAIPVLEDLMACSPVPLQLASAGTFSGDERVVFVAPVVTPRLLEIHARVHAAIRSYATDAQLNYLPRAWVPHVTLAQRVSANEVGLAIDYARDVLPLSGHAEILWAVAHESGEPVETYAEISLARRDRTAAVAMRPAPGRTHESDPHPRGSSHQ